MDKPARPSRSQQNLLEFIDAFVKEHGYGPSYREIMRALDYKSVSTVAVHIDGLIAKGKLRKHGRSARSLEVVAGVSGKTAEELLVEKITTLASTADITKEELEEMKRIFEKLGLQRTAEKVSSLLTSPGT